MLFGILTPLHSWVVFTQSLSFFNENQNDEWKTNGAHPKINTLEFGDIYQYNKKNYNYEKFKNNNKYAKRREQAPIILT